MVAMDKSPDAPQPSTTETGSTAPGGTAGTAKPKSSRSRAKAVKAPTAKTSVRGSSTVNGARSRRGAAADGTAGRVATAKTTSSATGVDEDRHPVRPGWWTGRPARSRALYNRRIQRNSERWPLMTRVAFGLFSHPELALGLLGGPRPVEVDGRVLNRGTQVLLELSKRLPASAGGGSNPPTVFDLEVMRAQVRRVSRVAMPIRTDVYAVGRSVPGAAGTPDIPVRIYRQFGPGRRHRQAIVYYHGGGWVTGDLDSHDAPCRLLAAVSGCVVVSVGYRLAPEDPFPAAVVDALAAYTWVQQHAADVGHLEGQVGVMGDSAGGNLAAVVALETGVEQADRASEVPPPVAQGLIYPAIDSRSDSESLRTFSDGFFLTRETMEFFSTCYGPDRRQWSTPRFSPILADHHRGLAPALVVTAGFDPLRDDGVRYTEALRRSGVDVEYRCYDDQVHGFMGMGVIPDCLALATEVCESMGRLMRRSLPAPVGD